MSQYLVVSDHSDPEVHDSLDDVDLWPDDDAIALEHVPGKGWVEHKRDQSGAPVEKLLGSHKYVEVAVDDCTDVKPRKKLSRGKEDVLIFSYDESLNRFVRHEEDADDDDVVPEYGEDD